MENRHPPVPAICVPVSGALWPPRGQNKRHFTRATTNSVPCYHATLRHGPCEYLGRSTPPRWHDAWSHRTPVSVSPPEAHSPRRRPPPPGWSPRRRPGPRPNWSCAQARALRAGGATLRAIQAALETQYGGRLRWTRYNACSPTHLSRTQARSLRERVAEPSLTGESFPRGKSETIVARAAANASPVVTSGAAPRVSQPVAVSGASLAAKCGNNRRVSFSWKFARSPTSR
jgi:hypothetical protein